jgi:glycosyltransferase involved in cell wall biosynthesis
MVAAKAAQLKSLKTKKMQELKQQVEAIRSSGLFDDKWYLAEYSDVAALGMDPVEHYLTIGAQLHRNPSRQFDTQSYLVSNPDVAAAEINPLLHYVLFGRAEGRGISAVASSLRPGASEAEKKLAKVKGGINRGNGSEAVIRGWLAEIGSPLPRKAVLVFDETYKMELQAATFRADLKKALINDGKHAFEVAVPQGYIDGKPHNLKLVDQATQKVVGQCDIIWQQTRRFKDFTGFLADSAVSPMINAPFREEDKRCFAAMENVAKSLAQKAVSVENQVTVSVVMPVHNRLATVQAAIDSVLTQTYTNFELVIVDDGSADGSYELMQGIDDARIRLVRLDQCGGVSAARNEALRRSTGKYIAYLDSDNTWDERYLAAMVGSFVELPDAIATYSGQLLFRGEQEQPFAARFGSFNSSLLANRNYIDLNAFCHTRAVYQKIGGFDTDLRRYVDWDLIMRMSEEGAIYSVPVLLSNYYYEKAENTITGNDGFSHFLDVVRQKRTDRMAARRKLAQSQPLQRGISIIIPSYESLDDLRECLDSIFQLNSDKLEIIVVDNASSQPVVGFLQQMREAGNIKFIANKTNFGFTHAVNQGIALAAPENDVMLLNNDALLIPGALEALQKSSYSLAQCGLVVPQQVLPGGTKTIAEHVPFANPNFDCDVNLSAHHANIINPSLFSNGQVTEIGFAPFFCVYIKRDVLKVTGLLDAEYGRHYRSDRIFCDHVRHILGLRIYHIADAIVIHKLQKATDSLRGGETKTAEFDLMFKKNQWGPLARDLGYRTAPWDV